ncbi:MAG: dihydroneopterin aldolase [Verrucomicrobiaceae bacterium]|nr:dihydroneopterin aldolase [Verrucomicrobiaceae bacterium]
MNDEIIIAGLEMPTRIGVPDVERSNWQTLVADITLRSPTPFDEMGDAITHTIDYEAAANRFRAIAAARPRHLIETLAAEIAECALDEFGAASVCIELRKRILPGTNHVAVRLCRSGAA